MFDFKSPELAMKIHQLAGNIIPSFYHARACGKSITSARMFQIWAMKQYAINDPIRPLRYV